jgi:hypothetical protein
MRNIDGSDWLKNPELEVVQTAKSNPGSSFTLTADEVSNAANPDDAGGGKARKGGKAGKVMASNGSPQ